MSTESANFKINLDASGAKKSLDDVRSSAQKLGGGLDSVVGGLDKVGGKAGADAEKAVRSLSFALGSAGGAGSEFLGVLGDLSGVLSGGALALALSGVGLAIGEIYKTVQESNEALKAFDEQLVRTSDTVRGRVATQLTTTLAEVKAAKDKLATAGLSGDDASLVLKRKEMERLDAQVKANEERIAKVFAGQSSSRFLLDSNKDELAASNANLKLLVEQNKALLERRNILQSSLPVLEKAADVDDQLADKAMLAASKLAEFDRTRLENAARGIAYEKENLATWARQRKEQLDGEREVREFREKNQGKFSLYSPELAAQDVERTRAVAIKDGAVLLDVASNFEGLKTSIESEGHRARRELAEKAKADNLELEQAAANAAVSIGVSAIDQLITSTIEGQDHVLELFAANIFKQAGTALVGLGTQAIGKGIFYAADPFTAPLAPQQFAVGALLTGAGVGMGALGTGIAASLGGASGASLGGGGTLGPARDPGVSFGGSSAGGSSSGPAEVHVHFEYGVGPTPEKAARDLQRVLGYGQVHGIIPKGRAR